MVEDLVDNYLHSGMHFNEVKELLGAKDSYRTDPSGSILYGLYDDYGMDIDPIESKTLTLVFSDSLLTEVIQTHWIKDGVLTTQNHKLKQNR